MISLNNLMKNTRKPKENQCFSYFEAAKNSQFACPMRMENARKPKENQCFSQFQAAENGKMY